MDVHQRSASLLLNPKSALSARKTLQKLDKLLILFVSKNPAKFNGWKLNECCSISMTRFLFSINQREPEHSLSVCFSPCTASSIAKKPLWTHCEWATFMASYCISPFNDSINTRNVHTLELRAHASLKRGSRWWSSFFHRKNKDKVLVRLAMSVRARAHTPLLTVVTI